MINGLRQMMRTVLYPAHYGVWLTRYLKLRLGFNCLRDIKIVSVEFSSVCNLRCRYCCLEQKNRAKFLNIDVYEKLIKEISQDPRYKIRIMEWPISGAFFVYPEYKKVIEITKRYWEANPNFRPHIILNDNLMLLDDERINLILRSGIICQVICSIDGHDERSYERMRPPARFSRMKDSFYKLVKRNDDLGRPVHIQINNGRDELSAGKPLSREMQEMFQKADSLTFWVPQSWNESFNEREERFKPANGPCTFVFNNVTLSSGGHVLKCCMDLKGSTDYADLSRNSLDEIWHSAARKQYLALMFGNERHSLQGCRTCAITSTDNDNRFNGMRRVVRRYFVGKKPRG